MPVEVGLGLARLGSQPAGPRRGQAVPTPDEVRHGQHAAGTQHPPGLAEELLATGEVEGALDRGQRVERRVGEGQPAGVAGHEVDGVGPSGDDQRPGSDQLAVVDVQPDQLAAVEALVEVVDGAAEAAADVEDAGAVDHPGGIHDAPGHPFGRLDVALQRVVGRLGLVEAPPVHVTAEGHGQRRVGLAVDQLEDLVEVGQVDLDGHGQSRRASTR